MHIQKRLGAEGGDTLKAVDKADCLIAREREPARVVRARSQHRAKRLPHQRAERMSTAFGRAGVFIEEEDQGPRMRCE